MSGIGTIEHDYGHCVVTLAIETSACAVHYYRPIFGYYVMALDTKMCIQDVYTGYHNIVFPNN